MYGTMQASKHVPVLYKYSVKAPTIEARTMQAMISSTYAQPNQLLVLLSPPYLLTYRTIVHVYR